MGWPSQQHGSFERFLVALAARCSEVGAATHLVFPAAPASQRFASQATEAGARFHELPLLRHHADPRVAPRLARILRRSAATHLHAHFGPDAYHALATARLARVRHRYTTKHIVPSDSAISKIRHRWLAAQVDAFFTVSEDVRSRLLSLGVPAEKLEVTYLGIDPDAYRPGGAELRAEVRAELGLGEDERIVLSTSHMRPGKGVEALPELARELARDPGGVTVVAAGDGPLRAELERSGPDALRTIGVREDVPRLLAAADAFVFPTATTEGMPLGPLEALAAEIPLVASAVSDLPRLLDGSAGLVPPGDVRALVAETRRVLTDRDLAARRSEAGRELVRGRLSVARAAELHTDRYLADAA
jgi:glycosyltransferase involved in cell wall biosynthesis